MKLEQTEWDMIRFIIGEELDALKQKEFNSTNMDEVEKVKMINKTYFSIRERVEKNVNVERG